MKESERKKKKKKYKKKKKKKPQIISNLTTQLQALLPFQTKKDQSIKHHEREIKIALGGGHIQLVPLLVVLMLVPRIEHLCQCSIVTNEPSGVLFGPCK